MEGGRRRDDDDRRGCHTIGGRPDRDEPFPSDPEAVAAVRTAAQAAHRAAGSLASAPEDAISGALRAMAGRLGRAARAITAANEDDMRAAAEAGLTGR